MDAHLRANGRAHIGHANAFRASWEVMCRVRCSGRENTRPHTVHSLLIAVVGRVAICGRSYRKAGKLTSSLAAKQNHPLLMGHAVTLTGRRRLACMRREATQCVTWIECISSPAFHHPWLLFSTSPPPQRKSPPHSPR